MLGLAWTPAAPRACGRSMAGTVLLREMPEPQQQFRFGHTDFDQLDPCQQLAWQDFQIVYRH